MYARCQEWKKVLLVPSAHRMLMTRRTEWNHASIDGRNVGAGAASGAEGDTLCRLRQADGAAQGSTADGASALAARSCLSGDSGSRSRRGVRVVARFLRLALVVAAGEGEELRGATDETSRAEVGLEVLGKVVSATEPLAAALDRAAMRPLLRVRAVVALQVLHALETLAAVAYMQLVCRADDQRWWASVASASAGRCAAQGGAGQGATAVEQRERRDGSGRRQRADAPRHCHRRTKVWVVARRGETAVGC